MYLMPVKGKGGKMEDIWGKGSKLNSGGIQMRQKARTGKFGTEGPRGKGLRLLGGPLKSTGPPTMRKGFLVKRGPETDFLGWGDQRGEGVTQNLVGYG